MLVLTSRVGEKVFLGDDIVVIVVEIHGNRAKLGYEAPTDIRIYREEVKERIEAENANAERTGGTSRVNEAVAEITRDSETRSDGEPKASRGGG